MSTRESKSPVTYARSCRRTRKRPLEVDLNVLPPMENREQGGIGAAAESNVGLSVQQMSSVPPPPIDLEALDDDVIISSPRAFAETVRDVQLTLDDSSTRNINVDTAERLCTAISEFKAMKIQRMQKLQELAATMVDLWSLMDTPLDEQERFHSVTRHIAASVDEINEPNLLSSDFISFAEGEVLRLQQMKSCKIKEVICKKRLDLEDRCRKAHMIAEANSAANYSIEAMESGKF